MEINLTAAEIKTLNFYVAQALIDARGLVAIGFGNRESVRNLESIQRKLRKQAKSR